MARRQLRSAVPALAMLLAAPVLGAAADRASPDDRYRWLVDRYRSGDTQVAIEVAERARSGRLPRRPCDGGDACEAAAVLNLDAASRLFASALADQAHALLDETRPLASRQPAAFASEWLLAAGYLNQGFGDHDRAYQLYGAALALRPGAPRALLARATALEFSALPDGFGALVVADRTVWQLIEGFSDPPPELAYQLGNPGTEAPFRGKLLELLAQQYRGVLARDPGSTEARLRLGRVLEALGRHGEGDSELRAAAASPDDPLVASVARLCLARLEPSPEGAAAAYRSALDVDPSLAQAWLGLSQSLRAHGDRAGARDALDRLLSTGDTRALSAWMEYHLGRGRAFPEALRALLAGLKPPS